MELGLWSQSLTEVWFIGQQKGFGDEAQLGIQKIL